MIAILTHDAEAAINQLRRERTVEEYSYFRRKGVFFSGREFMVVTDDAYESLMGIKLQDYRIIGRPDKRLVDIARTRIL